MSCLGVIILVAHNLGGMFGVSLGALGMLGTMKMGLTINAYGPISDNAGGIAEMSGMPETMRALTDRLDAAGNAFVAIGKGFAIGSAPLVSLALFGAFTVRTQVTSVDISNPWVSTGLLLGALMPYAIAAWSMKLGDVAAIDMGKDCLQPFPMIMGPKKMTLDCERCIMLGTMTWASPSTPTAPSRTTPAASQKCPACRRRCAR